MLAGSEKARKGLASRRGLGRRLSFPRLAKQKFKGQITLSFTSLPAQTEYQSCSLQASARTRAGMRASGSPLTIHTFVTSVLVHPRFLPHSPGAPPFALQPSEGKKRNMQEGRVTAPEVPHRGSFSLARATGRKQGLESRTGLNLGNEGLKCH